MTIPSHRFTLDVFPPGAYNVGEHHQPLLAVSWGRSPRLYRCWPPSAFPGGAPVRTLMTTLMCVGVLHLAGCGRPAPRGALDKGSSDTKRLGVEIEGQFYDAETLDQAKG